jgi:hypothetical protein
VVNVVDGVLVLVDVDGRGVVLDGRGMLAMVAVALAIARLQKTSPMAPARTDGQLILGDALGSALLRTITALAAIMIRTTAPTAKNVDLRGNEDGLCGDRSWFGWLKAIHPSAVDWSTRSSASLPRTNLLCF